MGNEAVDIALNQISSKLCNKMKVSLLVLALVATLCNSAPAVEQQEQQQQQLYEMAGSSYVDCGSEGDVFHVTGISVSPDTIQIPGDVTVSFTASASQNVSAPITLELSAEVKVSVVKVDLCKEGLIPNCTFADICSDAAQANIPLCPIPAGTITEKQLTIPIPAISIPVNKLEVKAKTVFSQNGKELGCFQVDVDIKIKN